MTLALYPKGGVLVDVTNRSQNESTNMPDSLRQVLALVITIYPVLLPLLEQLNEEFRAGLDQVVETIPKINQALNETDAVPELAKLFQKANP